LKQRIELGGVQQLEVELGLIWPVSYWLDADEHTCRIYSDPAGRTHEVILAAYAVEDLNGSGLIDLVHELCHAFLVEHVDPAFGTAFFSKEYAYLEGQSEKDFAVKYYMFYLAWCHVDIWVDDVRHAHWPELTQADSDSFVASVYGLVKAGQWQALKSSEALLGIALHMAETERHGLEKASVLEEVVKCLSNQAQAIIAAALGVYRNLPPLTMSREQDLVVLEQSVKDMAEVLSLSISPRLEEEEGRMVWHV
jgi:hypothetical protein